MLAQASNFECCVEKALKFVELKDPDHIYTSTSHCKVHLNSTMGKIEFLSHVIRLGFRSENETTASCEIITNCLEPTRGWYNVYVLFWIVVLIIGFLGNILVCVAFCKSNIIRSSVTNYFVTSLAVADLLVVFFIVPVRIHFSLHNHNHCSVSICRLFYTTDVSFFVASITNLFVITIDRFFAVVRPYNYKKIVTPTRAKWTISLVWVYSVAWGVLVNYNPETSQFNAITLVNNESCAHNDLYFIILYFIVFSMPSLIMLVLYLQILRIALFHAKNIDTRRNTIKSRRKSSLPFISQINFFSNRKLEFRATKVVLVVYGTFVVCWLPLITIATVNYFKKDHKKTWNSEKTGEVLYTLFGEILPVLNSLLNPFIYGILHRDFKRGIKRMLGIVYLRSQLRGSGQKSNTTDTTSLKRGYSTCFSPKSHTEVLSPMIDSHRLTILSTTQESNVSNENETERSELPSSYKMSYLDLLPSNDKKLSLTDSERTVSSDEQNLLLKDSEKDDPNL